MSQNEPRGGHAGANIKSVIEAQRSPGKSFNNPLANKVAVVTGAARGIGRAIAVDLATNGADVIGLDLCAEITPTQEYQPATREELDQTGELVRAHRVRWLAIPADIRKLDQLREICAQIDREFGGLDIVVANAGVQVFKPLLEMDDAHWHDVIDNNLNGTANTIRAFAPALVRRGTGRIILVSSMQGRYGTKHGAAYSASKWGIIGLMKSAALELGKHKITVNTIEPGLIDTAMTRNDRRWSLAVGETTGQTPEHPSEQETKEARLPRVPLGVPWLSPEQVSPVAVFLASDAAAMITGACYDVTGGDSAHNTA
jgi:NAD(P)-dependent dehydrogenase (short-subunit alcohol dehydrogenase family)